MAPPKMLPDEADPTLPLPDPRHEMFAQCLSDGMTQTAAYESAGFVAHSSNANLLSKRPAINARVQYLIKKKADDAGMTFAGRIVVDLEKVGPDAKKMSPEWFLFRVMTIAEDDGVPNEDGEMTGGAKPADQLKALQMGADWLGYFKEPKNGPMKPKDGPDVEAVSSDRTRRIVAGKESALSRYSDIVDGLGDSAAQPAQDGVEGADHASGDREPDEHVEK